MNCYCSRVLIVSPVWRLGVCVRWIRGWYGVGTASVLSSLRKWFGAAAAQPPPPIVARGWCVGVGSVSASAWLGVGSALGRRAWRAALIACGWCVGLCLAAARVASAAASAVMSRSWASVIMDAKVRRCVGLCKCVGGGVGGGGHSTH